MEWIVPLLKKAGKTVWIVIDGGYTKRPFLRRALKLLRAAWAWFIFSMRAVVSGSSALDGIGANPQYQIGVALAAAVGLLYGHFLVRRRSARSIQAAIAREYPGDEGDRLQRAFGSNTRITSSIFEPDQVGWNRWNRKRLRRVIADADHYVQTLNDRFTDPSGKKGQVSETPAKPSVDETSQEEEVVTGEVITRSTPA